MSAGGTRGATASPEPAAATPAVRPDRSSSPEHLAAPEDPLSPQHAAAARETGARRFAASRRAVERFFPAAADPVARACWAMARRFHRGGRLLVWGAGAARSDALHVAVEFVHPVIVGKRALPALALPADPTACLALLARPQDVLLVVDSGAGDPAAAGLVGEARRRGLLTLAVAGLEGPLASAEPDHLFVAGESDPLVAQEVQETLYHVLWELVHVFLDHRELLA